jgi:hypothetical protein
VLSKLLAPKRDAFPHRRSEDQEGWIAHPTSAPRVDRVNRGVAPCSSFGVAQSRTPRAFDLCSVIANAYGQGTINFRRRSKRF